MSNEKTLAVALVAALQAALDTFQEYADDLDDAEPEAPVEEPTPKAKPATGRGKKAEPEPEEPKAKPAGGRGKKAEPEPEPEDDVIVLEDLQELVATLLENGKRRVVSRILKDFDIKSIGDADEEDYDELYNTLFDEVEKLEA